MITHTLAGWRDAVSTRLITNEDDTWGPLFWDTSALGSSNCMHDLWPILFSCLWVDRGGIRLIFLGTRCAFILVNQAYAHLPYCTMCRLNMSKIQDCWYVLNKCRRSFRKKVACSRPSDSGEWCEMEIGKNAEKRERFCSTRHSVHRTSYPEGPELATWK